MTLMSEPTKPIPSVLPYTVLVSYLIPVTHTAYHQTTFHVALVYSIRAVIKRGAIHSNLIFIKAKVEPTKLFCLAFLQAKPN